MFRLQRALLILLAAVAPGCNLLPGGAEWQAEIYPAATFDDVFDVAAAQIDKEYEIALADRDKGRIETSWDYDSVSPITRYLQRERVVAEVAAVDEGVELKLRVQTQVRENSGILAPDALPEDEWGEGRDDRERAEVIFSRIHTVFFKGRPSEQFYRRPMDPTEAP